MNPYCVMPEPAIASQSQQSQPAPASDSQSQPEPARAIQSQIHEIKKTLCFVMKVEKRMAGKSIRFFF